VAGLARAIEDGQMGRSSSMPLEDLIAEAALDPAISGAGLAPVEPGPPEHALLTGATGFVGAFLVHDLLTETGARVYCLVRAESAEEGHQRVRGNLEAYGLWDEAFDRRIEIVPGDLSAPLLGLSAGSFKALAERIDTIYHNGAMVNIIHAYHAHKPANVLGTQEVLRLATTARLKPVHFVSTLSVFHTGGHLNGVVFREDASLVENGAPYGGYAQSKWVAERLVMAAMERGIPAAIYRPGLISGASESGAWNTEDIMSTLTRVCLAVGAVPALDVMVDVVPVDYVSRAIVHLSQQPDIVGRHLPPRQPASAALPRRAGLAEPQPLRRPGPGRGGRAF
jgi:myxalamid-type nonribosomal peptide synthetase MxaA